MSGSRKYLVKTERATPPRVGPRDRVAAALRRGARFILETRGAAAVEFALVAPLLVGFLAPIADIGMRAYAGMQVEIAAQAGAQYALLHGYDSTAIQNAVTAATAYSSITASPAPTTSCGCASGNAFAAATCGSACANGETAGTYVTVNAQTAFTSLFTWPGMLHGANTLSSQATVRIQ